MERPQLPKGARSWRGLRVLMLSPTPTHPQDFGNRKRIFRVCQTLTSLGASLSFIHYPAEDAWRTTLPRVAERAMVEAWDAYYTAPITRGLHSPPGGTDHRIDEWWDESIGALLQWLFAVGSYDVFIVNYAWLSKALEYAPASVFKILDTHDRVAGRRELLTRHGIAPEFFYTTEEEEAIALARADLVWAIKDEERADFARRTSCPVRTLAHLDESEPLPAPAEDPEGYLRVAIVGARNNINVTNIENFLSVAIPLFDSAFAPVKIQIAGSVCQDIKEVDDRFVELVGPLADMRDFYETIDVACIPMEFSTGLKIKTAEALSYALPVVSLAHSFEGFAPQHRFHRLRDHSSLAEAIIEIAFDRGLLARLRAASAAAYGVVQQQIARTIDESWQFVQDKAGGITICTDSAALRRGSVLRIALESSIQYLRYVGQVKVVVISGSIAEILQSQGTLNEQASLFASADLAPTAADSDALAAIGVSVVPLTQAIEGLFGGIVVLDSFNPALENIGETAATLVARTGYIELQARVTIDPARFAAIAARFRNVFAVGPCYGADLAALACAPGARGALIPNFFKSERLRQAGLGVVPRDGGRRKPQAVILWDPRFAHLDEVCQMLAMQGCDTAIVADCPTANGHDQGWLRPRDFLRELEPPAKRTLPELAIDLSFGAPGLQFVSELLMRLRVPVVEVADHVDHRSIAGVSDHQRVGTYLELAWEIGKRLSPSDALAEADWLAVTDAETEGDGGWAWLWRHAHEQRDNRLLGIAT